MKRIIQINSFNGGSTGNIARNINSVAKNKGFQIYFLYGRYWKSATNRSDETKFAYDLESVLHVLFARIFDCMGLLSTVSTKRLIRQIKKIQPDIIHLHNIHGYYINYPILFRFLKESEIPVVWTLHDCWSFTGHCSHFDKSKCEQWKSHCRNCIQKKEYPKSLFCDRAESNFTLKNHFFTSLNGKLTLVPVSDWLGNLVKFSFFKNIKTSVIHNGCDLEIFKPVCGKDLRQSYNLGNKKILLGVACPFNERKGIQDFVRLNERIESDKYVIVLIGVSEQQQKVLPQTIISILRTSNQTELAEWYSSAEVFVNLTYEDNFPTVNIEALACGTPVITYRTGGSPEAINEKTGIVVKQGDIDGVLKAIKSLQMRPLSSDDCRRRAEELFDKNKCFEKYIRLYESLL